MDRQCFPTTDNDHDSQAFQEDEHSTPIVPRSGCSSPSGANGQTLSSLSSPFPMLGTTTTHSEEAGADACLEKPLDISRPDLPGPLNANHTLVRDWPKIDTAQEKNLGNDPEHAIQTASMPPTVNEETVQRLNEQVDELARLLRISNNTVESLNKLLMRYRVTYGELSEGEESLQSVHDSDFSRGPIRIRSFSRSPSPGNFTLQSNMSEKMCADACRKKPHSTPYDGCDKSPRRKSHSSSASLSSRGGTMSHSRPTRSPRTPQEEIRCMGTRGFIKHDDEANSHEASQSSSKIAYNSHTPTTLPEDTDLLSVPGFSEGHNSPANSGYDLENKRSARSASVESFGQPIKHRRSFRSPEPDLIPQQVPGYVPDRAHPSTRPRSRFRSSWRHWTNPTLQAGRPIIAASPRRSDPNLDAPKGSRIRSRYRGPAPARPFRRKTSISHSASREKVCLTPRRRPDPNHSGGSRHRRDAMDISASHTRDIRERKRTRTPEPRLLHRFGCHAERELRKIHHEDPSHVRNEAERSSSHQASHPRDEKDRNYRGVSHRGHFSERY